MLMKAGQKKERNLSRRRRESKDQDWARRTRKWNYTCKRTKTKQGKMEEAGRQQVKYRQFRRKRQKRLHQPTLMLSHSQNLKTFLLCTALFKHVDYLPLTCMQSETEGNTLLLCIMALVEV